MPIFHSLCNWHLSLICQFLIQLRKLEAYPYNVLWHFHLRGRNKSIRCLLIVSKFNLKFQLPFITTGGNTSSKLQQIKRTIMQVGREEGLVLFRNIFHGVQYFTWIHPFLVCHKIILPCLVDPQKMTYLSIRTGTWFDPKGRVLELAYIH
jgi:hypothetical protein